MKEKFVTNISFATVHLINHSSDRIHCLVTFYYKKKNAFFSTSFIHVGWEYVSVKTVTVETIPHFGIDFVYYRKYF
jgi:hypothetical protein